MSLHPNIMVQRSPSHFQTGTFYWAHHEKLCVIDNTIAFMGGLDACFGRFVSYPSIARILFHRANRWDTPQHVLTDDNLDTDQPQIWPGKWEILIAFYIPFSVPLSRPLPWNSFSFSLGSPFSFFRRDMYPATSCRYLGSTFPFMLSREAVLCGLPSPLRFDTSPLRFLTLGWLLIRLLTRTCDYQGRTTATHASLTSST